METWSRDTNCRESETTCMHTVVVTYIFRCYSYERGQREVRVSEGSRSYRESTVLIMYFFLSVIKSYLIIGN